MDSTTGASPRQLGRIAGALYLINVVCGAFAIGYVQATLLASDPATTAVNIQAHELLYRTGLAAHVLVTVTNVPLALIFYELFKVVNRRVALLTAFFILVATAIEAAGLLNQFAPLILLAPNPTRALSRRRSSRRWHPFPGTCPTLTTPSIPCFFGLDILCLSYLLFRSRFVPRAIAVLLAIDGLAYLIYSFTDFLAPTLAAHLTPWIQLPAPVAEKVFSLWLLKFGVNVEWWTSRASGETRMRFAKVETLG